MTITYFNYLWDIDGISAGSAIKGKELVRALRELGHTVYLEWRTPQPDGRITIKQRVKESLKPRLQKFLHEPKKLALNIPHLVQEYRILKNQNPDILFSRLELYNVSGLLLSRALRLPLVIEADCPPTYEHMTFYGRNYFHLGTLPEKLELQNLRHADAIIAISRILKEYYVNQGIDEEKIHVIPNGADPEKFRPREKPADLVSQFGLHGKVVIGWIGALVGWNGLEILARVAQVLLNRHPEVAVMMVGGGENQAYLEKHLCVGEQASRVALPGRVSHDEVPRYLACMDIVLAPYPKLPFWYPSSMKVFEYMAAGKAVVASAVGQIQEIIRDWENGVLFDPDNEHELIDKLSTLISDGDMRRCLGAQARRDVLDKYSWRQHARTLTEIFEQILERRKTQSLTKRG